MIGQSRLELILDLNNRIGTGLAQARSQIHTNIGGMESRLDAFSAKTRKNLDSVAGGFLPIKQGLTSLINPVTLAVTAVGALTTGLFKATNRAAEFNHEFRDLANLNLSKSQQEIDDLRRMVLNSAWRKGFNAERTSNAYNELQSTAAIEGAAARVIVEKQGEFALLMKTNMDDYIAGTAKAMANWRFGNNELDNYNKSNYAAMQVGVVSFEELAKVQSIFAGAAASINQTYDTANKLFSIFTVRTKSVDEAATLTKSLFNDLTKSRSVKAFKSIGIDLFDDNKQLKQADVIMLELNKKFQKMKNDKAIVNLKNQFVGSEGLIAMIQAATDRSGELRNMLDEFQDSKFNADMALSQAHNDIIYRQENLSNRIDNLMIRLGHTLLPIKEKLVGMGEWIVEKIHWSSINNSERKQIIADDQDDAVSEFDKTFSVSQMSDIQYKWYTKNLKERFENYNNLANKQVAAFEKEFPDLFKKNGREAAIEALDAMGGYSIHKNYSRAKSYESLFNKASEAWDNRGKNPTEIKPTADTGDSGDFSGINDSLNRVVGAAKAPRNIYINIDAFNKGGINTQNTSLQKMDEKQIEDWFTDMCMRVVNNVELSYSN